MGADAQTIEQSVATPIEQQMSGVDNLNYMYSLNAAGNGQMTMIVNFDVKTDPNTDLMLTQMRETQAASQLPQDVTNFGVTVQKSVTAPLMVMGLFSPNGTYDGKFLANYSYINLNDQLTRVPGIGNVQVFGAGQYAMRLWVKPDQLAKLGITVTEVVSAIQAQNTVNPAGQVGGSPSPKGQEYTYSVRAQGRLTSPEEFGDIVVRELPDGGIVRVRDVARIELGAQDYTLSGRINGKPGAIIAVYQLPGTNAVDAAKGVRKLMEEAKKRFPQDVDYVVSLDTTESVTEGIRDIVMTILIAIALVTVVVYLFLQGWRATLIPLLAVPVSLIGTFMLFPAVRILHQHALAVRPGAGDRPGGGRRDRRGGGGGAAHGRRHGPQAGRAESDGRNLRPGDRHRAGALGGVRADGIHSRNHRTLYQQFAVTIAISVILSAFNALTLSPALSALLLKPKKESRGLLRRFFNWFNRMFERATNGYIRWSGALIRKSAVALVVLLVAGLGAAFFSTKVPASFLPGEDQGYMFMHLQLPNASSLERTEAAAQRWRRSCCTRPA